MSHELICKIRSLLKCIFSYNKIYTKLLLMYAIGTIQLPTPCLAVGTILPDIINHGLS